MNTPLSRQMDQMADAQEWKKRAEAAEAAHRDAAAQWQDEARLRREAEAKLARCVEALHDIAVVQGKTLTGDMARAALAAAKGE